MTSFTKPEVHIHNVHIQRRKRRTEPEPQATCTKYLTEFGSVIFVLRERTDRQTNKQTNRHTHHNTSHPFWRNNKKYWKVLEYFLQDVFAILSHAVCKR